MAQTVHEPAREIPIVGDFDVVVCGGGPAGVAAAVTAARAGAQTGLIEAHGCLGGIWTAGLMAHIIDMRDKGGLIEHITATLDARGAKGRGHDYDIEAMKLLLDEICLDANVRVRLHTRVAAAACDGAGRLRTIITESKSGREAWTARAFIDCTGDGDLAAQAGCAFDVGRPGNGESQPMSLIALIGGIHLDEIREFTSARQQEGSHKATLCELLEDVGTPPSYGQPTLFPLREDLFMLMSNHEYGRCAFDAAEITEATVHARAELHRQTDALRSLGGAWKNMCIVATSEQIGVREGRRIHGRYTVTEQDITSGARHPDGICRATFGVDIHSTNPTDGKGCSGEGRRVKPYDIPLRSLVAKDVDGLLMAGRCISGDFFAHASYRVTGNAVAMGEAAGFTAAKAALSKQLPHEIRWDQVKDEFARLKTHSSCR
ncbi:MAG: FAD-dependent oxidoreductase [Planctomycetes bacterium]|nr:FAD-dependent oxidoreductase [Planctomycetota bacterium]